MKRHTELTKAEAAHIIRHFVAGEGGAWDWDDFLSIEITDPQIAATRDRCNAIQGEYPSTEGYCNQRGCDELLRLADQLEQADAGRTSIELKGWEAYDYRGRSGNGIWITRTQRSLIIVGFCLTIPLAIVGLYIIYWAFLLHHMFIMGWSR